MKKNTEINQNDKDYIKAFSKLKELIIAIQILIHPDFNKAFTLVTDASNFALGAALLQTDKVIC